MKFKGLNLLLVVCISAIMLVCTLTTAAQDMVTNPIIRELEDDFYISTEYGTNIYIENGVRKYYDGKITFLGIDSNYSVFVNGGEHEIVLDDVRIHTEASSPLDITGNAVVSLKLENGNLLSADNMEFAAVHVDNGSKLTISGDGKLFASGGRKAACIGGNYNDYRSKSFCGDITITSGEIVAKTGIYAIGHATYGDKYDILLPGDEVDFEMTGGVLFT